MAKIGMFNCIYWIWLCTNKKFVPSRRNPGKGSEEGKQSRLETEKKQEQESPDYFLAIGGISQVLSWAEAVAQSPCRQVSTSKAWRARQDTRGLGPQGSLPGGGRVRNIPLVLLILFLLILLSTLLLFVSCSCVLYLVLVLLLVMSPEIASQTALSLD